MPPLTPVGQTKARSASKVHPRSTRSNDASTRPARNAPTHLARASGKRSARSEGPAAGCGSAEAGVGTLAPLHVRLKPTLPGTG